MSVTRRKFLTLSAACALLPGSVQANAGRAETWEGRAFGGDVSLRIQGPREQAAQALADARGVIRHVEGLFSLYDPASDLSRLNRTGVLDAPAPRFLQLMRAADHAYALTGGLFDPTVGALWAAIDCAQAWYAGNADGRCHCVTVQLQVEMLAPLTPGETYALVAWQGTYEREWDGRKRGAGGAVFASDGICVAKSSSFWISV